MNRWLAGALSLFACTAGAVADSPALYSHTLPVQFQGSGSLVQLRLPKDVYLRSRSRTLDDLRLFDGHGQNVPFALTMPLVGRQPNVDHPAPPPRVFALEADSEAAAAKLAIRTSPDGTLLSVETQPVKGATLAGLLLDLGEAQPDRGMVTGLVFAAPAGPANYSARVRIEESDDLQDWSYVAEGKLDWLSNGRNDTLANNRIAFDARPLRYLRVLWREGTPRRFAAIAAERAPVETLANAPDTMLIAAQPGKFAGDWVYPVGRAVPVRTIGMQLAETGLVLPSEVGRYVDLPRVRGAAGTQRDREFTPLLRTTFYRIAQKDGTIRTPPDTVIAPLFVDQLVVRPAVRIGIKPPLRVGWLPATMIFAARSPGPYTLAMGRDNATSAQAALSDVAPGYQAPELLTIASAAAGPAVFQHAVGGDPSAAQSAGTAATARTAVLWGVLLLGVLVLAVLSWRMVKQMRAEDTARSNEP